MALIPFFGYSNPVRYEFEAGDDILNYNAPVGLAELSHRLAHYPWLKTRLEEDWAAGSDSPFINAHAANARIITAAIVLGTRNPHDLADVLGLPVAFILVKLLALKKADWDARLVPEVRQIMNDPNEHPLAIRDVITDFMQTELMEVELDSVELEKAMGYALL